MTNVYKKWAFIIVLLSMSLPYCISFYKFKVEIEHDNSVLEWSNDLLQYKKESLEEKESKKQYYRTLVEKLFRVNHNIVSELQLLSDQYHLEDFSIDVTDAQHYNTNNMIDILWNDINVNFICGIEQQILFFIEKVFMQPGVVLQSLEIYNLDEDKMRVKLYAQDYYLAENYIN